MHGLRNTCGWRTADGRRPQRRLGQQDVAQWHVRQPGAGHRIGVRKTYKLYIGGAFPRSRRSLIPRVGGRQDAAREYRSFVPQGCARRGPCMTRTAFPGWAKKTAMNRGQVLYRVAELMEGRRDQFVAEVAAAEACATPAPPRPSIVRSTAGSGMPAGPTRSPRSWARPVAAPYFSFTIPEPTGVVGVVAPETSSLLGLVSRLAPPLVSGNAVVLLTSEARPLPAITLSEVLATSDVPGGVVNILTGRRTELVPVLAGHVDVDALDTWGVPDDMRLETERLAADDIKRLSVVTRP